MSAMIQVTLTCGGCEARALLEPIRVNARWESIYGGEMCSRQVTADWRGQAQEWCDEYGWWLFDPATNCTYCAECRQKIEANTPTNEKEQ